MKADMKDEWRVGDLGEVSGGNAMNGYFKNAP